jgi:hypothetical protein
VLACAVLEIELRHFIHSAPAAVHLELLEQGLHNDPSQLRQAVQAGIDRIEANTDAEAIVLGYGLCSRGIEGIHTKRCRLVVPRAHDCITILLGSKEHYAQYVQQHPGTYWYSPGWNASHTPPGPERYQKLYEKYRQEYDEDDAEYLMEMESGWMQEYNRATYVDLTVGATDEDVAYTQRCAEWLKWDFDRVQGDPGLLLDLLNGQWDDQRFLVIQPGQTLCMSGDERVLEAVPLGDPRVMNEGLEATPREGGGF